MAETLNDLFDRIGRTTGETICMPLALAKQWLAHHEAFAAEIDARDQEDTIRAMTPPPNGTVASWNVTLAPADREV